MGRPIDTGRRSPSRDGRQLFGENPVLDRGFRPDIEGLRAVAILLVVADHLAGWPVGGFVGVDVFFVISGFLITGVITRPHPGGVASFFGGFYLRRAKRILPAALVVIAVTVAAAHVLFRGSRVSQTVSDGWWATLFAANIHFSRLGVDYFQRDRAPSPLQHYWSLAVEEQFYLVWPVLVVACALVAVRLRSARRADLRSALTAGAAGVVVLGSFAWSVVQSAHEPAAAYFSAVGRAWELGAGALLALTAGAVSRLLAGRRWARDALSVLGLAGIAASALLLGSTPGFPAPVGLLPVASTVAVIAAGTGGGRGRGAAVLTNPASRYVGRVSYSAYLWHWPVIVFTAAALSHDPTRQRVVAVLLLVGATLVSHHLVEVPGQRLSRSRPLPWNRVGVAAAVAAIVVCGGLAGAVVLTTPARVVPDFAAAEVGGLPTADLASTPDPLARAITQSLSATHFPALTPALSRQGTARAEWGDCADVDAAGPDACTFGSRAPGAPVALVVGDSMAMGWIPAVAAALGPGWRVVGFTLEACPVAAVAVVDTNDRPYPACDAHHAGLAQRVRALDPGLVVLSSAPDSLGRLVGGAPEQDAPAAYGAGMRAAIGQLDAGPTRRVVTLSPPPAAGFLNTCDVFGGRPADCVRPIGADWITQANADAAAASATGTDYVDTRGWFCSAAGWCPAFVGTTAVRWDSDHLTDVYARSLARPLAGVLHGSAARR